MHHQGHPSQLAVQGVTMLEASVIEELLAVVRGDDDHGILPIGPLLEFFEEPAHGSIHRQNLLVVEPFQVLEFFARGSGPGLLQHPNRAVTSKWNRDRRLPIAGEGPPHLGCGVIKEVGLHEMQKQKIRMP